MSNTYALSPFSQLLNHGTQSIALVRDIADYNDIKAIDIKVASGDYFATLATQLDQLTLAIAMTNPGEVHVLQNAIDDLLYLQSNYTITKK